MKFLYWNTNNIDSIDSLIELSKQESPELFFLSEIDTKLLEHNLDKIQAAGYNYFVNPGCERVSILKKNNLIANLSLQNKYYTTVKLTEIDTYVISIHLPSQMFQHMDALKEFIRDFRFNVDIEIGSSEEKKILIIGDFNVNPYEKSMVDFDGFVASNSVNARRKITHLGKTRTSYYNPTWQLYSRKQFPGTKYFKRPSASSYDVIEFHFLDQVVLSTSLLDSIVNEKIDVIEQTENFHFYNKDNNSIQVSDHLPLSYQFKI